MRREAAGALCFLRKRGGGGVVQRLLLEFKLLLHCCVDKLAILLLCTVKICSSRRRLSQQLPADETSEHEQPQPLIAHEPAREVQSVAQVGRVHLPQRVCRGPGRSEVGRPRCSRESGCPRQSGAECKAEAGQHRLGAIRP